MTIAEARGLILWLANSQAVNEQAATAMRILDAVAAAYSCERCGGSGVVSYSDCPDCYKIRKFLKEHVNA